MSTREKLIKEKYYAPYCINCSTMGRMTRTEKGFICEGKGDFFNRKGCSNSFEFPEEFLKEYESVHGESFSALKGKNDELLLRSIR